MMVLNWAARFAGMLCAVVLFFMNWRFIYSFTDPVEITFSSIIMFVFVIFWIRTFVDLAFLVDEEERKINKEKRELSDAREILEDYERLKKLV